MYRAHSQLQEGEPHLGKPGAADIYLTQEEGFRIDHALEHMTMSQAFGGHRSN